MNGTSYGPAREGPRERALGEGFAALAESELLALLLGSGASGHPVAVVAPALLERAGGLVELARTPPLVVATHPGVGLAKALRIGAAVELGRRIDRLATLPRTTLDRPYKVAAYFHTRIGALEHEEMWLACLDGRGRLRACRRVAQGGMHGCAVTARDVLRAALEGGASSFVLVHNHPSGDPTPSAEDKSMTRVLALAGATIGVPLVDHVIVAPDKSFRSLHELGLVEGA